MRTESRRQNRMLAKLPRPAGTDFKATLGNQLVGGAAIE